MINKVVESETQEILPFAKMQDDEFVSPEHLQAFEPNTIDFDKTIYDMNVKEEITRLKNKIDELERGIKSLNQSIALCVSSLAGLNTALINMSYNSVVSQYYPINSQYVFPYQMQIQNCCNGYKKI